MEGIKEQDDTFAMIFTLDKDDDWRDERNWPKASPNYGVSVEPDKMREQLKKAINRGGRTEVTFKTKNLNLWVDAPETWISDEKVVACNHGITLDDLKGQTCYGGIDLASHVDINAFELYFPNIKGRPVLLSYFWVPEAKVEEMQDRVDYRKWVEEGWMNMTEGDVIDIDQLVEDISEIIPQFNIVMVGFDPAKAYHGVVQGLQKAGFEKILQEFPQGIRYMSQPTREIEREVTAMEVDLMGNPVLRWMFSNAVTITDANDNIKFDKKKSQNKIDGVVAAINARGTYMSFEANAPAEPYKEHTLRVLTNE
ncbi:hypothetical protein J1N10_00965 [Carboxylicivirga sp. A043]|uniref:terminase TerL endonuclease subunit n=1 Tax=Carboxylicivirga litoralis TaxID=2816963 RepID=UPI0021CB07AC|nr:terminase TerL endonuclease subunit [Carboxylicivirga sp. A043]MCU4154524.1 hypothetical protein [Carboxylicivirga sp. A043]